MKIFKILLKEGEEMNEDFKSVSIGQPFHVIK